MYANHLELKQFRNYQTLSLDLGPHLTIVTGDNAQGKTNLLEALYLCATGRSWRTYNEKECIARDKEEAYVGLDYMYRDKKEKVEMVLRRNARKSAMINGYPVHRINDLFGRFHVVVFSPEDLYLVKGSPSKRRRFLDMEISQQDPIYLYNLQQYTIVLKQRNRLLKTEKDPDRLKETLFAWDKQLAYYGIRVIQRRMDFLKELTVYTAKVHEKISGGKEEVTMKYEETVPADQEIFLRRLELSFDKDRKTASTTIGPQHDDVAFLINGIDVRIFGSQGQQRTLALSLKIAVMQMMRDKLSDSPVLLLDDVMSELDHERQRQLTEYISSSQTILTCTGVEDSLKNLHAEKILHVEKGEVRCE